MYPLYSAVKFTKRTTCFDIANESLPQFPHSLSPHSIVLSVPSSIPSHHSHTIAKLLIGDQICPESFIYLFIFQIQHCSTYLGGRFEFRNMIEEKLGGEVQIVCYVFNLHLLWLLSF